MIGSIFRQEREKKQLTLKDVENETNIRTLYLEAIENENYKAVRGEVYLKGFIKTYAKALGLNPDEMLSKYYEEQTISARAAEKKSNISPAAQVNSTKNKKAAQKSVSSFQHRVEERRHKRNTANIVFGLIIFVIIIGCAAYFIIPAVTSPAEPAAPAAQSAQPAQPTEAAASSTDAQDGVHINAVFNDKCWVKVSVDGKTVLEKTADKGNTFKWDGKKDIEIVLGNANAAKITLNGKDVGKLGDAGTVVTKKFTKDKVEDIKK